MSDAERAAGGAAGGCLTLMLLCGGCLGISALFSPSDYDQHTTPVTTQLRVVDEEKEEKEEPKDAAQIYAESMYDLEVLTYEQEHREWEELAKNEDELAQELEVKKYELDSLPVPEAPKPQTERTWTALGSNITTKATLVDTDNENVTLRKTDGQTVSVKKEILVGGDRAFVQSFWEKRKKSEELLAEYHTESNSLSTMIEELEAKLSKAGSKPVPPDKERIFEVVQAEFREREQEERRLQAEMKREADARIAVRQREADARKGREDRITRQFNSWNGSHINVVKAVKRQMNDAGSFEHVETRYRDHGDSLTIFMEFRGKNAYGGKILSNVTAKVDMKGNVLSLSSF
ncbi:hypothetical protein Pla52o_11650 [Novipirellula galeiformis]|uniref:SLA1 homology domain-containing protein n=1 Tax=Novipirellula galeiformis TaxID=2528004 RepID=A0A5C6CJU7_9BACT|nr:hypothetical protein [Novipirellula galeiformis]TWU24870.1 hypothetical protein Pla52o_11650 [Novipirellula galeiformis]